MAQHGGGIARAAVAEGVADGGRGDLFAVFGHQIGDGHAKAQVLAKILQHLNRSRPFGPEVEIRADNDVARAQALGQHAGGEILRRQAGQRGVEGQFIQDVDADLVQPVRARLGSGQAEGRGVGGEQLARMRFEGQYAKRGVQVPCRPAGQVDHGPVPDVDAIEIADGDGSAPIGLGGELVVAHDPHGAGVAPCCGGRKWRS